MLRVNFSHIPLGWDPSLKAVRQQLGLRTVNPELKHRVCSSVVQMFAEQKVSCAHHLNQT